MTKWERSQEYEKKYIESTWNIPYSEKYWLDFMQIDSVHVPALDVGCGASGIWRFNDSVIGVDPIDFSSLGSNFKRSKAEELPFLSKEFVDVYCINALDHTEHPDIALREIGRVCKERVVLWTYSFPTSLLKSFYDPHPYAFTTSQILKMLPQDFKIEKFISISAKKEFSKYNPTFLNKLRLDAMDLLGIYAVLIHLKRNA